MANADRPNGLRPVRHLNGSPWNGAVRRCYVPDTDSTAIFVGDLVTSAGSGDADGVPSVAQASAGGAVRGVVTGIEVLGTNLESPYRVASTERYVYVCEDPDVVFEIQEDSVGNDLAATHIGNNGDVTVAAGNTTSGASGMELDSSNVNSTGTGAATLNVLGLVQRADNEIGSNAKWEVFINEHEFRSTTGT
jgi:hypothetical protein